MVTRLLLISHAATEAQRVSAFPSDDAVDDSEISKITGMGWKPPRSYRAWSGPERRAQQTAEALGLTAEVEPELRDCNYGAWSGRKLSDIYSEDPNGITQWMTNPAAVPHGGESIAALMERISQWLDQRTPAGGDVIAVTHPAVIRSAVVHVLKAPTESFWRIDIEPLSATDIRFNGRHWTLRSVGSLLVIKTQGQL